jgi:hypothetical protein
VTPEISARIHELRRCAEQLRATAMSMRFRASRADLMAIAESYDRLADKLDSPKADDIRNSKRL